MSAAGGGQPSKSCRSSSRVSNLARRFRRPLAVDGGVVMLPDFVISETDCLHKIDPDAVLTREVWLIVHSEIKNVPSVRVVSDALRQIFVDRRVR